MFRASGGVGWYGGEHSPTSVTLGRCVWRHPPPPPWGATTVCAIGADDFGLTRQAQREVGPCCPRTKPRISTRGRRANESAPPLYGEGLVKPAPPRGRPCPTLSSREFDVEPGRYVVTETGCARSATSLHLMVKRSRAGSMSAFPSPMVGVWRVENEGSKTSAPVGSLRDSWEARSVVGLGPMPAPVRRFG